MERISIGCHRKRNLFAGDVLLSLFLAAVEGLP